MESMLTTLIKSEQEQLKVINVEKKKTQLTSSIDVQKSFKHNIHKKERNEHLQLERRRELNICEWKEVNGEECKACS
jgi:hypothetical protein